MSEQSPKLVCPTLQVRILKVVVGIILYDNDVVFLANAVYLPLPAQRSDSPYSVLTSSIACQVLEGGGAHMCNGPAGDA